MTPNDFRAYMHKNGYKPKMIQGLIDTALEYPDPNLELVKIASRRTNSTIEAVLQWVSWHNHRVLNIGR